jgi:hypothetical protein
VSCEFISSSTSTSSWDVQPQLQLQGAAGPGWVKRAAVQHSPIRTLAGSGLHPALAEGSGGSACTQPNVMDELAAICTQPRGLAISLQYSAAVFSSRAAAISAARHGVSAIWLWHELRRNVKSWPSCCMPAAASQQPQQQGGTEGDQNMR